MHEPSDLVHSVCSRRSCHISIAYCEQSHCLTRLGCSSICFFIHITKSEFGEGADSCPSESSMYSIRRDLIEQQDFISLKFPPLYDPQYGVTFRDAGVSVDPRGFPTDTTKTKHSPNAVLPKCRVRSYISCSCHPTQTFPTS